MRVKNDRVVVQGLRLFRVHALADGHSFDDAKLDWLALYATRACLFPLLSA